MAQSSRPELPVKRNAFVHKLYDMLNNQRIAHLIWWANTPEANTFLLCPNKEFAEALSNYFKHENVASFVRQLHMYGFHKVSDPVLSGDKDTAVWEFRHLSGKFRKNDEASLVFIKRRLQLSLLGHMELPSRLGQYEVPYFYQPQYVQLVPGIPVYTGGYGNVEPMVHEQLHHLQRHLLPLTYRNHAIAQLPPAMKHSHRSPHQGYANVPSLYPAFYPVRVPLQSPANQSLVLPQVEGYQVQPEFERIRPQAAVLNAPVVPQYLSNVLTPYYSTFPNNWQVPAVLPIDPKHEKDHDKSGLPNIHPLLSPSDANLQARVLRDTPRLVPLAVLNRDSAKLGEVSGLVAIHSQGERQNSVKERSCNLSLTLSLRCGDNRSQSLLEYVSPVGVSFPEVKEQNTIEIWQKRTIESVPNHLRTSPKLDLPRNKLKPLFLPPISESTNLSFKPSVIQRSANSSSELSFRSNNGKWENDLGPIPQVSWITSSAPCSAISTAFPPDAGVLLSPLGDLKISPKDNVTLLPPSKPHLVPPSPGIASYLLNNSSPPISAEAISNYNSSNLRLKVDQGNAKFHESYKESVVSGELKCSLTARELEREKCSDSSYSSTSRGRISNLEHLLDSSEEDGRKKQCRTEETFRG